VVHKASPVKMAPLRTLSAALFLGAGAVSGFAPTTPTAAISTRETVARYDVGDNDDDDDDGGVFRVSMGLECTAFWVDVISCC